MIVAQSISFTLSPVYHLGNECIYRNLVSRMRRAALRCCDCLADVVQRRARHRCYRELLFHRVALIRSCVVSVVRRRPGGGGVVGFEGAGGTGEAQLASAEGFEAATEGKSAEREGRVCEEEGVEVFWGLGVVGGESSGGDLPLSASVIHFRVGSRLSKWHPAQAGSTAPSLKHGSGNLLSSI
jgi:hypothetical protein